eukprot:753128_1
MASEIRGEVSTEMSSVKERAERSQIELRDAKRESQKTEKRMGEKESYYLHKVSDLQDEIGELQKKLVAISAFYVNRFQQVHSAFLTKITSVRQIYATLRTEVDSFRNNMAIYVTTILGDVERRSAQLMFSKERQFDLKLSDGIKKNTEELTETFEKQISDLRELSSKTEKEQIEIISAKHVKTVEQLESDNKSLLVEIDKHAKENAETSRLKKEVETHLQEVRLKLESARKDFKSQSKRVSELTQQLRALGEGKDYLQRNYEKLTGESELEGAENQDLRDEIEKISGELRTMTSSKDKSDRLLEIKQEQMASAIMIISSELAVPQSTRNSLLGIVPESEGGGMQTMDAGTFGDALMQFHESVKKHLHCHESSLSERVSRDVTDLRHHLSEKEAKMKSMKIEWSVRVEKAEDRERCLKKEMEKRLSEQTQAIDHLTKSLESAEAKKTEALEKCTHFQRQIEEARQESLLEAELAKVAAVKPYRSEINSLRRSISDMESSHRASVDSTLKEYDLRVRERALQADTEALRSSISIDRRSSEGSISPPLALSPLHTFSPTLALSPRRSIAQTVSPILRTRSSITLQKHPRVLTFQPSPVRRVPSSTHDYSVKTMDTGFTTSDDSVKRAAIREVESARRIEKRADKLLLRSNFSERPIDQS